MASARGTGLRPHEIRTEVPLRADASLAFIGVIRTPWPDRESCPRQGRIDGPECRVELDPAWEPALAGIEDYQSLELLYWLHASRRDLLVQKPNHTSSVRGTFALRSPVRPNPIGTALVRLVHRDGPVLIVRGLDCLDGTPLIDLKPDRCQFTPEGAIRPLPAE